MIAKNKESRYFVISSKSEAQIIRSKSLGTIFLELIWK